MEDQKHTKPISNSNYDASSTNKSNDNSLDKKRKPYLSKRGQYNPLLKQQSQIEGLGHSAMPGYSQHNHNPQGAYHYSSSENTHAGAGVNQQGQQPYQPQYPPNGVPQGYAPNQPLKHSGLGITSFIFALLAIFAGIIYFILAAASLSSIVVDDALLYSDPAYIQEMLESGKLPSGFGLILGAGFSMLVGVFLSFIGSILGLISVFQKNRKKVFGIIGLIINGGITLISILMLFIVIASAFA